MKERTCETCADEKDCGADNKYACATTNFKRWQPKPVEVKESEYEKAKDRLIAEFDFNSSDYMVYAENESTPDKFLVVKLLLDFSAKLEALALAEGERRERERPHSITEDYRAGINEGATRESERIRKAVQEMSSAILNLNGSEPDTHLVFKEEVLAIIEDKEGK